MDLLVATDFSTHGKTVLEAACKLARPLGAKVWVIHVVTPPGGFRGYGSGPRTDRAAAAADIREEHRLVQEAAEGLRAEGLEAVGLLVEGPPVQTLLDEAARLAVDLVVVGSHGYGAVFKALLGSVSAGVIRRATCPVLVIPVARNDG
jgi:nucleotide-binding universal stress UspA family protein